MKWCRKDGFLSNMKRRTCPKCNTTKKIAYFTKRGQCIKCFRLRCNHIAVTKKTPIKSKEEKLLRTKLYYQNNKAKFSAYKKLYLQKLDNRIKHNLRCRLSAAIKHGYKTSSAVRDLGCSIEFFKEYLNAKFTEGMNWDNYGEWHIDHIKPLSSFNLEITDESKIAAHYSNLQPLWAKDNLMKSNRTQILE